MNFAADFNYTHDLLRKFNESPGTMSLEEVRDVREFILGYIKIRDMFHKACGFYPIGLTLESYVDKADWYLEFHKNKKGGKDVEKY